ncbi:MAG TPA: rhodanese-related sulfurtransferase [Luteibaculaceae bacterium]|nr:rhodanese-related sulfurtransferase [Luteibaculaceae bacterium]
MPLHNKYDKDTLRKLLESNPEERITLSFYQYAHIVNPQAFRDEMFAWMFSLQVLGRIYVAKEGINAQISVPAKFYEEFKDRLYSIPFLNGIRLNEAIEHDLFSFLKLKIKVRNKIVADGLNDETFDVTKKGIHLKAPEFNQLVEDPNTILVDMRNHYEWEIGKFRGAITPDVDTFKEALAVVKEQLKGQEDKNLVMYCTGGIRCEKASAYYKHLGFQKVYQLEGGIIEYTRKARELGIENKFIGKNFVFDDRRAEKISDDVIARCHQCGTPFDVHSNCANDACHLLFIQCTACQEVHERCCSDACKEFIRLPADLQREFKSGKDMGVQTFKKGRDSLFVEAYLNWKTSNLDRVNRALQLEKID